MSVSDNATGGPSLESTMEENEVISVSAGNDRNAAFAFRLMLDNPLRNACFKKVASVPRSGSNELSRSSRDAREIRRGTRGQLSQAMRNVCH